MKKALILTVMLLLLLLLVACGGEATTETADTTTQEPVITTVPTTTATHPVTEATTAITTTQAPITTETPETQEDILELLEFTYVPEDRGYHLVGFGNWEGKELTVPSEYEGKKVVAIGDNENDITMLKNADISMVPSNAVDAAKLSADFVLECDCNHSAVAFAIEKLKNML